MPQDYALAASWRRKAAEQGSAANQSLIGMMYTDGLGVPQDSVLAHMWFNLRPLKATPMPQRPATSSPRR